MILINNKYNSLPQQVDENKSNLDKLSQVITDNLYYNVDIALTKTTTQVNKSNILNFNNATTGYLLDTTFNLFKIELVAGDTVYVKWLARPQGEVGPQGEQGPKGEDGLIVNGQEYNLSLTEVATADNTDGLTFYNMQLKNVNDNGEVAYVNLNIPIVAGNNVNIDVDEDNEKIVIKSNTTTEIITTNFTAINQTYLIDKNFDDYSVIYIIGEEVDDNKYGVVAVPIEVFKRGNNIQLVMSTNEKVKQLTLKYVSDNSYMLVANDWLELRYLYGLRK